MFNYEQEKVLQLWARVDTTIDPYERDLLEAAINRIESAATGQVPVPQSWMQRGATWG